MSPRLVSLPLLLVLTSSLAACGPTRSPEARADKAPSLAGPVVPQDLPQVLEGVLPSVVSVHSSRAAKARSPMEQLFGLPQGGRQEGLGSGVILSADGVVVTNNHVVEGADEVLVKLADGREFPAKVLGTDPKSDLAVLKVDGEAGSFKPIKLGDSAGLRLGEMVLAVGNPFGVGQTVTMGIVSAKGRADMGIVDYEDFIQTDAAINPGNSGGALINARGELVGINTAILSKSGGYMGIGFAIPTHMAEPIVAALRQKGKVSRGFMGAQLQEVTPELREALKLPSRGGVLVADVVEKGPAAKAGIKSGDVVLAVGGQEVQSSGQLRNLVAQAGAGNKLKLKLSREGKTSELEVELEALPGDQSSGNPRGSEEREGEGKEVEGLVLRELIPELRARLELPSTVEGVLVTGVRPGSRAAKASLLRGDLILEVDHRSVTDPKLAHEALSAKGAHLLTIYRRGARVYAAMR